MCPLPFLSCPLCSPASYFPLADEGSRDKPCLSLRPYLALLPPNGDASQNLLFSSLPWGERGSFRGGLPLESLVIVCPQEGRGTWLVGEVAGVSPQNQQTLPLLCASKPHSLPVS